MRDAQAQISPGASFGGTAPGDRAADPAAATGGDDWEQSTALLRGYSLPLQQVTAPRQRWWK
jgi:hypothetical protein